MSPSPYGPKIGSVLISYRNNPRPHLKWLVLALRKYQRSFQHMIDGTPNTCLDGSLHYVTMKAMQATLDMCQNIINNDLTCLYHVTSG